MPDKKIFDKHYDIPRKRGNGQVRKEAWADQHGIVTRYNLAFINHRLFHRDNGRVLGYDNAHGPHHRHYFGEIEPIDYTTFEDIEAQFERELAELQVKK